MTGLYDICKMILAQAIMLCPADTMSLAKSGEVKHISRGVYRVQFGAGTVSGVSNYHGRKIGVPIDYALYVHEDESMDHPRGGQAKFLEDAGLYVMNICIANQIPCGMNLLLGYADNGSPNCVAIEVFDPNIVKPSMVSGIPLGCELGVNNSIGSEERRGWRTRIRGVLQEIVSAIKTMWEGFTR